LSIPVQVIAWRTVSVVTCNVSSGTLNLTYSLTHSLSAHIRQADVSAECQHDMSGYAH